MQALGDVGAALRPINTRKCSLNAFKQASGKHLYQPQRLCVRCGKGARWCFTTAGPV
jgi:hypothetical protein